MNQRTILFLATIILLSCNANSDKTEIGDDTTAMEKNLKYGDYIFVAKDSTKIDSTTFEAGETKSTSDSLPFYGALDQTKINQYYPNILDTVKDRRIIVSGPVGVIISKDIHVSMLHNTGTFDQMFLCTHDKNFKLLYTYYIGTATMFDRTSHTIEYKQIDNYSLRFDHVNWGMTKKNGVQDIDTTSHYSYTLTVTKSGKILKK